MYAGGEIPDHWLKPRMYTLDGTPEPSRSIAYTMLQGNVEQMKKLLKVAAPTATIYWHWEPYANIQRQQQLECLALVLDDPRFRFDAEFVCASCYFTPKGIRNLVCGHPRAQKWVKDLELFHRESIACYNTRGRNWNVGLRDRTTYGYWEIQKHHLAWLKIQRWRLAFLLYPALRFWVQRRVEEMYAPGGSMFLKGEERWNAAWAVGGAAAAAPGKIDAPAASPPSSHTPPDEDAR